MKNNPLHKANEIVRTAHKGQTDLAGMPYEFHPFAVAGIVKLSGGSEDEQCIALLHDVIEDSNFTGNDLLEEGFSKEIVDAVLLLTKKSGEDYLEYVKRIKINPSACKVKIADLTHNLDSSRLPPGTVRPLGQEEKYKEALRLLKD